MMKKNSCRKENDKSSDEQIDQVKSFQEISNDITAKPNLKQRQPTPQPKDFDEIDY